MSNNLEELLAQLSQRKHWKKLPSILLSHLIENSQDEVFQDPKCDIEVTKNFIFISEQTPLVQQSLLEANFIPISKDSGADVRWALDLFAVTLYRFGSDCCKMCVSMDTQEEALSLGMLADVGFVSSILCNPLYLLSYAGMAFLHGEIHNNNTVGVDWCRKYRRAEERLLNTPDNLLSYNQMAEKEQLIAPYESTRAMREKIAEHAPHLLAGMGDIDDEQTMSQRINDLEKELLNSQT